MKKKKTNVLFVDIVTRDYGSRQGVSVLLTKHHVLGLKSKKIKEITKTLIKRHRWHSYCYVTSYLAFIATNY